MRRTGRLFDRLVSFENLLLAAHRARTGKRSRPASAAFQYDLEGELFRLQEELEAGTWRPGTYRIFQVREPKTREIAAAPYRDRVVHHALLDVIEPVFERTFTADSFSCRRGFGTHRALDRFSQLARRHAWVLKADVARYFPSIDHCILIELLSRKLKDARVLEVLRHIIESFRSPPVTPVYFPGDHLFSPLERDIGIPIGNLTSQFFANVYLDPLDHHVREHLRVPGYIRYTDDLVVFGGDPRVLAGWRLAIDEFLGSRLRLRLHARKTQIFPVSQGTHFLGWRVFRDHRLLLRPGITRARRRLARLSRDYRSGEIDLEEVRASLFSWLGHVAHGSTYHLRQHLLAGTCFTTENGRTAPGCAGRVVEQRRQQPALRLPQQQRPGEQEQQRRFSVRELSALPDEGPGVHGCREMAPAAETRPGSRLPPAPPGAEQIRKGPPAS